MESVDARSGVWARVLASVRRSSGRSGGIYSGTSTEAVECTFSFFEDVAERDLATFTVIRELPLGDAQKLYMHAYLCANLLSF